MAMEYQIFHSNRHSTVDQLRALIVLYLQEKDITSRDGIHPMMEMGISTQQISRFILMLLFMHNGRVEKQTLYLQLQAIQELMMEMSTASKQHLMEAIAQISTLSIALMAGNGLKQFLQV